MHNKIHSVISPLFRIKNADTETGMECADSKVSMDNISRNKVSAVGTEKVSK